MAASINPSSPDFFGNIRSNTTKSGAKAVWVGADNALISMKGDSRIPANIYATMHTILHENLEAKDFAIPKGVFEAEVSNITGQKPTSATRGGNGVLRILVSEQTAPKNDDTGYVYRQVDVRFNLLANVFDMGINGAVKGLIIHSEGDFDNFIARIDLIGVRKQSLHN